MIDNCVMTTFEHLVPADVKIESVQFTTVKVHAAINKLEVTGALSIIIKENCRLYFTALIGLLLQIHFSW